MHFSKRSSLIAVLLFATTTLIGCGNGAKTATGTTTGTVAGTAASISLSTSATSVKSDNSNSATITITALDTNNASLSGQTINLTASSGQLSSATATTGTNGSTTVTFSGGTAGLNKTATITASIGGVSNSIPIQITGSTLNLSTLAANVAAGTPTDVTVVAKNAAGGVLSGQTMRFSIAASSTGSGTLSATSATTSATGTASVNLTGTAAGAVNVLVEWLDATGAVTASATQAYTITGAGGAFQITTPATSPFAVTIGVNQNVIVNVPATVSKIRYATTLGSWQANGLKVLTVNNPGTGSDTQVFVPGISAGNASVQVDALDAAGAISASAKITLAISATATSAASVKLQPSTSVLQPSSGSNLSTATLTATVMDATNNPVGGASVLFELVNSTGTGETISPVVVTTNATAPLGIAQSTFTAGTTSTTQGAQIKASVIGAASSVAATTNITVGGTAGSIAIGVSTTMTAVNSNTAYSVPVSVMVTDSNGNAVPGATVSLSIWPVYYYKGTRNASCGPIYLSSGAVPVAFPNEDRNENLLVDPGEDIDGPGGAILAAPFRGTPDGKLWPIPSAAGSIPATVTTAADGTATFNWVYLKQYANWVDARIRATTLVQGSQSTSSLIVNLIPLASDVVSPCALPPSPYN